VGTINFEFFESKPVLLWHPALEEARLEVLGELEGGPAADVVSGWDRGSEGRG
jgi:hypothetical protein